jgi:hypothetical protein
MRAPNPAAAYGISLLCEAPYVYPGNAEWTCFVTDYSECLGNEHHHDHNFTVNGAQAVSAVEISVRELMALCLAENQRRFSGYDRRLLRPGTMPRLVRFGLHFMRAHKTSSGFNCGEPVTTVITTRAAAHLAAGKPGNAGSLLAKR